MTTSHREIPVAFTAVRVDVTAALAYARRAADETGADVSLTEIVIAAVARLHEQFPALYAQLTGDGRVIDAAQPSVGLTVDVGTGLFLPVIRDAAKLDLGDLADAVVEVHREVVLDVGGAVRERMTADLGPAYDHRLVNGAQAGAYLAALSAALQL
ncbi:2-oxo acid dehydrogenase subunit E2 [Micromonospora sp. NPDC048063]|uniref:2-oxo acid dehydrogenase subunit E2 n=1 Tax=Micromonospora sp. NPDC048063 TaxID=3364256 RepID=UPI0037152E34